MYRAFRLSCNGLCFLSLGIAGSLGLLPRFSFAQPVKEFDNFYVIGDSLNDSGIGKSLNAGDINFTNTEIIHQKLWNSPLVDFRLGGSNFSVLGNTVFQTLKLLKQVNLSTLKKGQHNLYYILLGANDIKLDPVIHPLGWGLQTKYERTTNRLLNLVEELGDHQNHTVIVNTVPDFGITPLFSCLLVLPRLDFMQIINFYGHPYLQPLYTLTEEIYKNTYHLFELPWIAQSLKMIGFYTPQGLREYARNFFFDERLPLRDNLDRYTNGLYQGTLLGLFIPGIYNLLRKELTRNTRLFNEIYFQKLLQTDENLVIVDLQQALEDLMSQYSKFGFDDIVFPGCAPGTLSLKLGETCNSHSPFLDESRLYAFADVVHPSAQAQQAAAEYALAILGAPIQYSSLLSQQIQIAGSLENKIDQSIEMALKNPFNLPFSQLSLNYSLAQGGPLDHQGIKAKRNLLNTLDFSYLHSLSQANTAGILASLNYGNSRGYENYHYLLKEPVLSLFDLQRWTQHLWSSIEASYGALTVDPIRRTIPLYKGAIQEEGHTKGILTHLSGKMGYLFNFQNNSHLNTYLGLTQNRIHIKGFDEKFHFKSMDMSFAPIHFKQTYATLGLQYWRQLSTFYGSLALAVHHQFSPINYSVAAGLKKFARKFKRKVTLGPENWLDIQVALGKSFNRASQLQASLGIQTGVSTNVQYQVQLSWSYHF
ncbi:MAG: autotransporter domain-containing protein [Neisseriaceae bacterium]